MTIKINCKNLNSKRRVDLAKIEKIARKTLRFLKKDNLELNIFFFSSQKIRAMSRRFLGVDRATDVIAFPGDGTAGPAARKKGRRLPAFFGDIAISLDKAAQNAAEYGTSFTDEVTLYVIHGILHLAGYDHRTKKDNIIMRRKENEFFQKVKKSI